MVAPKIRRIRVPGETRPRSPYSRRPGWMYDARLPATPTRLAVEWWALAATPEEAVRILRRMERQRVWPFAVPSRRRRHEEWRATKLLLARTPGLGARWRREAERGD